MNIVDVIELVENNELATLTMFICVFFWSAEKLLNLGLDLLFKIFDWIWSSKKDDSDNSLTCNRVEKEQGECNSR